MSVNIELLMLSVYLTASLSVRALRYLWTWAWFTPYRDSMRKTPPTPRVQKVCLSVGSGFRLDPREKIQMILSCCRVFSDCKIKPHGSLCVITVCCWTQKSCWEVKQWSYNCNVSKEHCMTRRFSEMHEANYIKTLQYTSFRKKTGNNSLCKRSPMNENSLIIYSASRRWKVIVNKTFL